MRCFAYCPVARVPVGHCIQGVVRMVFGKALLLVGGVAHKFSFGCACVCFPAIGSPSHVARFAAECCVRSCVS